MTDRWGYGIPLQDPGRHRKRGQPDVPGKVDNSDNSEKRNRKRKELAAMFREINRGKAVRIRGK